MTAEQCGLDAAAQPGVRILQLHPSLSCNLTCGHCYTDSGPWQRTALPLDALQGAVRDAADAGFDAVTLSGGEPLLYPHVAELLATARDAGLRTSLTTNGTLLTPERLAKVAPHLDGMAISLDGPREMHDRIRDSPTAFARLEAGLPRVRDAGIPFGLIHTLTAQSWEHIPWLARFAADAGATLVQLHPLGLAGRGVSMQSAALTQDDLCRAFILASAQGCKGVTLQLDAYPLQRLRDHPEVVQVDRSPPRADALRFVVVEADGTVLPRTSGLAPPYALGNLRERPLSEMLDAYPDKGRAFHALSRSLLAEVIREEPMFVPWNERLVDASHRVAAMAHAVAN